VRIAVIVNNANGTVSKDHPEPTTTISRGRIAPDVDSVEDMIILTGVALSIFHADTVVKWAILRPNVVKQLVITKQKTKARNRMHACPIPVRVGKLFFMANQRKPTKLLFLH